YVGHNDIVHTGGNPLENLRPQVIYNALRLPEIDSNNDIAVVEDSTEVTYDTKKNKELEQPDYVIDVIHRTKGEWFLGRKVVFDRTNLTVHQQIIYDADGSVATEATYQAYHDYNGV